MRFKGLDLNLLVALDQLLIERNVSAAATKLCLSQSATSGALGRLRDYFGDELLVQVGRRMALTPRAEELAAAIRHVLMQIETTVIEKPVLDLTAVHREITIIASDYLSIAYLAGAIRDIQQEAPGIRFKLKNPTPEGTAILSRGHADFIAMPERFLTAEHPSETLFVDGHAALVARDNKLVGDTLDVAKFMALRHVMVMLADGPTNSETAIADQFGNQRKMDVVVANFATVPFMLAGTDRVAIVHERLAKIFCEIMPLRMFPVPLTIPPLRIGLQWHELAEGDKVIEFVKAKLLSWRDRM